MKNSIHYLFLSVGLLISCTDLNTEEKTIKTTVAKTIEKPTNKVILSTEIVYEKLNPARGNQSPQAGTIWEIEKEQKQLVF